MSVKEDYLYQLGGVHPSQHRPPTRYTVVREDGVVMHESSMKSLAELWRFAFAPDTATVEVVK